MDTSKELKADDVAKAIAGNTATIKDLTMKTIDASAFDGIQGKELAYIDLSATGITGMEVSRSAGPFKGVSEKTFIYMPAGNTSTEPNVVIGGVCANMQMDGTSNAPFQVAKDFTAAKATLQRTFKDGKRATIYLPYAISQATANALGSFYTFKGITGTTVEMAKVTSGGLKASTPYIYVPEGTIDKVEVSNAAVKTGTNLSLNFVGTYEKLMWPVDQKNIYCFVGEEKGGFEVGMFARMGAGSWVSPFRAYMRNTSVSAPSLDISWLEDDDNEQESSGIKTVTATEQDSKIGAKGWFSVNGIRMDGEPAKKGLYIHNGKKVVK